MASRDLVSVIKVSAGAAGTAIDTLGFNSLVIASIGADATFTLTECDEVAGTYTAVPAEFVIAGGDRAIGYAGTKRYVKFADSEATQDSVYAVIQGHPVSAPVDAD